MKEIFKDIPWYNWNYKISNKWRIYSNYNNIFRKLRKDKDWYLIVDLRLNKIKKTLKVHRLVLITFIWDSNKECNHINWIKNDNRLENLEWVTSSENSLHRYYVLWHKWCVKQTL